MEREKLKSNKIPVYLSEKIYGALVKICGADNDYYEKESFIYHHSIVNNPLKEYKFKGCNNSMWEININEKDNCVKCKTSSKVSTERLVNKVVKHILQNKGKFYFR
jgi:hypothetical protein